MADVLKKANLFPEELVPGLIQKTKGFSALANLCAATPIPFNGLKEFTFQMDKEIDVVAESGAKGKGGVTVAPVTIVPIKVEYGARVSDEFMYASEEAKIDVLKAFSEGFARKVAKGLDLMALHGFNPRTGSASSVIGTNHFDNKVNQVVTISGAEITDPDDNIESAIALVNGSENEVNGLVLSSKYKTALSKLKNAQGGKLYPELAWGNNPGNINGLRTETTNGLNAGSTHDVALVGDFQNAFKWGYAKQIPLEIIQYGNPDNDSELGDLKGHNQVYIRAEAYIGWGILDPKSFAMVKTSA